MSFLKSAGGAVVTLALFCGSSRGADIAPGDVAKLLDGVTVSDVTVRPSSIINYPTLIWGGDVAAIRSLGGVKTSPKSTAESLGLKLQLVPGDDFIAQTKRYLKGEPFLRGELGQLAMVSEILSRDKRTKPRFLFLMTYSAGGDCMVALDPIRSINDLRPIGGKKKRVALQLGGPHMNLLNLILTLAKMSLKDIEIVWCKDLTGEPTKGDHPGARMRRGECDVAFVISPDRNGLTSGPKGVGNGKEGTVKGARDVLNTGTLSRGVADSLYVREDFYQANTEFCKKVAAMYMKGTYDLMAGQQDYDAKKQSPQATNYIKAITDAKGYFGDTAIPEVTIDGVGMVHDAEFQGIPGNISFFRDKGNLNGFEKMQGEVLTLANTLGFASKRVGFLPAPWDWKEVASIAGVKYAEASGKGRIAENIDLLPGDEAKYSFTVNFEVDQADFSEDTWGNVLDDCIKLAATYRNGVILVRGHSDVSKTLFDLIVALREVGKIQESGNGNDKRYFFKDGGGQELDLTNTAQVVKLIGEETFDGFPRTVSLRGKAVQIDNPKDDVSAMDALSRKRAEAFRDAIIRRAKTNQQNLDASQIQITGVGIREPLVARPKNTAQAKQNMRVQIEVREVGGEALSPELFNP